MSGPVPLRMLMDPLDCVEVEEIWITPDVYSAPG